MRALSCASAVTAILLAGLSTVLALTSAPVPPNPQAPRSEGTGPKDPRSTGSTNGSDENLSERLNRSDGVIRPPTDIVSDMAIRPAARSRHHPRDPTAQHAGRRSEH